MAIDGGELTLNLEDAISHSLALTVANDTALDSLNQNKAAAAKTTGSYSPEAKGMLYLALCKLDFDEYKRIRVIGPPLLLTPC